MTMRHTKKTAGKLPVMDRSLVGSAYSYYGGIVRTPDEGKRSMRGVKRMFATALLSGASVLAVGLAAPGGASAGTCVGPVNGIVSCGGIFDDTIEYDSGVEDVTLVLSAGAFIDTTENVSDYSNDNAGILVIGSEDVAVINNGSIFTGDNQHLEYGYLEESYWVYGGDGHHGVAAYSEDGLASVTNTAFGIIGTTSDYSYGMLADSYEGSAEASNAGLITTSGEGSHGVAAVAKYNIDVDNTGTISTSGENAHGIGAAIEGSYGEYLYGASSVEIDNDNFIQTSGENAYGIGVTSDRDASIEIANSGIIETSGSEGLGIAVQAWSSEVEIENSGTIETEGENGDGIRAFAETVDVVNTVDGVIATEGEGAYGVSIQGDTVSLENAGVIATYGEDAHAVVAHSGGIATTTITNTGLIEANGGEADAIRASGPTVRIYNNIVEEEDEIVAYGVIASENGAAIRVEESGDASLYNHSAIYGNVTIDADESGYTHNTGTISSYRKGKTALGIHVEEGNAVVVNDGDISSTGRKAGGVELEGYSVTLTNTGTIETSGRGGHAADLEADEEYGTATLTNSGLIEASGEEADAVRAEGETVRIANQAVVVPGEGEAEDTTVYGIIRSEDGAAIRIDETDFAYVTNYGFIYGNVDIEADGYAAVFNGENALIQSDRRNVAALGIEIEEGEAHVLNDGSIVATKSRATGIEVNVELGDAYVRNNGTVTTGSLEEGYPEGGWRSHGIDVFAEDNAMVLNTGDVTTYGHKAKGIAIETQEGTAAGVNSGTIDTWGEKSTGLSVTASSREHYDGYTWTEISGSAIAGNIGTIETRGDDASGAAAVAEGGVAAGLNLLGGSIATAGDEAHGLIAASGFDSVRDAVEGEGGHEGEGSIAVALNGIPPQLLAPLGLGGTDIGEGFGFLGNIAQVLIDALPQDGYDPADFRSSIVTTGDNAIGVGAFANEGTAIAANFYGTIATGTQDEYDDALTGYRSHGLVALAEDGFAAAVNKYHGDIVTNGDRAIGILASAEDGDAFAANKYEASVVTHGEQSHGMAAYSSGEEEYSEARAYNIASTIATYGEGSIGIVVSAEEGDAFAVNAASNGSGIIPSTDDEDDEEEAIDARIETWGEGAHGMEVSAWQGEAGIYNSGTIVTHGDSAHGARLIGDTVELRNYGTIRTYGYQAHGVVASSQMPATTTVYNDGTISATGEGADAIRASGPSVYITNTEDGIVSSTGGDAIYAFDTKYVSILNHGDITGDVLVSATGFYEYASSSYILNTGTVTGDIDTSAGESDDTIVVEGGTVTGAIYTGDGIDQVTVSGSGVKLGKGIHATESGFSLLAGPVENYATLTFEHADTITLDDGVGGWAISHFDKVDIDSGTLVLDGFGIHTTDAAGEIAVAEGAILGVTSEGAYASAGSVEIGGTLSIALGGWFDVSGDVSFDEGSTFRTQLSSDGAGVVYGETVSFSKGSSIFVDVRSGLSGVVGTDMLIASASEEDGVTDEGASVEDNTILFDFKKVMDDEIVASGSAGGSAEDLFLRVEIAQTAEDAELDTKGRVNLVKVARAIDKYISTQPIDSPLVLWLTQFETEEEQYDALLKLVQDTLPDESDGAGNTTVTSTDLIFDMIMDRLSGGGFTVAMNGTDTGLSAGDAELGGSGKWALWGRIGGAKAEYTPSGVNGFDADTWGGTVGIDGEVASSTRIGLGAFYTSSDVDENGAGANTNLTIDGYGLVGYLSYRPNAWYVNASLGYGMNEYDSQRRSLGGVNVADYDGTQFVARAEVGHMFVAGQWDITPNAGLRYNLVDIDGYTETGPLPISVGSRTVESIRAVGGVNLRYTMALDGGSKLIPEFGVKLLGELGDPDEAISGNVVGGGAFTTQTTPRDDVSYGIGGGLTYEASDRLSLRVTYDGEFQSDYDEQSLSAAIRFAF